jgi:hypothetical protein
MARLVGTVRKLLLLAMLGLTAVLAGCSLYSEAPPPPPPVAPGPTIVNNNPPPLPSDNSTFWIIIVLFIVGGIYAAARMTRNKCDAEHEAKRADAAERALERVLARHPDALTSLNGRRMYPSAVDRMPMEHPSAPMLEQGQC